jgi:hypothetical protein
MTRKHTLPSNDMNGKFPVRSLYITPLCLSANAPKQNMINATVVNLMPSHFELRLFHSELPDMVKRLETSYGVKTVERNTKKQVMVSINDVLK